MAIRWIVAFCIVGCVVPAVAREVVVFPDPVVNAGIREAIALPEGPIYADQLSELKEFMLYQSEARDLTGLEHCVNLRWLNCQSNKISNIASLAQLPKLERIWFSYNEIKDISALKDLANLTDLNLVNNPLEDLSPLAGMMGLKRLSLSYITIPDTGILSPLTGLEELYLSRSKLTDLNFVAGMTGLKTLSAPDNQITSLEPLRNLPVLKEIKLDGNQIEDISPLSGLREVWRLNLADNRLSSLEGMPGLTKVARVELYENRISDIRPLVDACGYTAEIVIELGQNQLAPEAFCRDIPELEARGNQVVFKYESPVDRSVLFPNVKIACAATGRPDGALILAAINRGATMDELAERFTLAKLPEEDGMAADTAELTVPGVPVVAVATAPTPTSPATSAVVASVATPLPSLAAETPRDDDTTSAALAVNVVDRGINVSIEAAGIGLPRLIGVIVFLATVALLIVVWRIPRRV